MRFDFRPQNHWRHRRFRYRAEVLRCANCGTVNTTSRTVCRRCRSRNLLREELPERGRLVAFTVVRSPTEEHKELAPYVVGLVEFEDGTRVVTPITDADPEELRPGTTVERVVRKIAHDGDAGIIVYGFKYRPAIS
ncbi:MAG: Zn-ribbon domain-containing OB-fold protein [Aigarchaeota archaeon]|nr:Zn-ribbon domain-containing OB-fold protein [Aigarchaeota archaeon]MCS7127189.1 Zn-ribbon domain-containing OB-fold protein [Candidatus Calditenuaceae archaeon]MCX8202875.1 Zn-ribbon domain-containing OB-fold protein [Nitrososphaeria archaeon]MDW8042644.1 Zn-ribbon domain-containing OB-fold protein [Nitrososphaerota archaeon]